MKKYGLGVVVGLLLLVVFVVGFLWINVTQSVTVNDDNGEFQKRIEKNDGFVDDEMENLVDSLSVSQKVGQLLMTTLEGYELGWLEKERLKSGTVSGYFILGKNVDDVEQVSDLSMEIKAEARKSGIIPFWGVDQEGGRVVRIPWINTVAQVDIASKSGAVAVYGERSSQLSELGFNMNFAPVIEKNATESSFLQRQDRYLVNINQIQGMIEVSKNEGIIPVVKHFPGGLGRVTSDPHFVLPRLDVEKEVLMDDLEPFSQAIADGVEIIMVTHLFYPEIDNKWPVSSSSIFMNEILKDEMRFEGVVMVDDVSMGAVKDNYELGDYVVQSILAGADMILVSDIEDFEEIYQVLVNEYLGDYDFAKRVDEGVGRVLRVKEGVE